MNKIMLYEFDLSTIKPVVKSKEFKSYSIDWKRSKAYWLGSVDLNNRDKANMFLDYVRCSKINNLIDFNDIENELLYSLLIEKAQNAYYIAAFAANPMKRPELILVSEIVDLYVESKQEPNVEVELDHLPKNFFLEIMKNIFRW